MAVANIITRQLTATTRFDLERVLARSLNSMSTVSLPRQRSGTSTLSTSGTLESGKVSLVIKSFFSLVNVEGRSHYTSITAPGFERAFEEARNKFKSRYPGLYLGTIAVQVEDGSAHQG
jgi:hypothetical protein